MAVASFPPLLSFCLCSSSRFYSVLISDQSSQVFFSVRVVVILVVVLLLDRLVLLILIFASNFSYHIATGVIS